MTNLTPTEQNAINQGSINQANTNNVASGVVSTPTIPSTLNSTNVASNPSFVIPPPPQDSSNYLGMIAGGNATIGANNATINPPTIDPTTGKPIVTTPVKTDTTPTSSSSIPGVDWLKNYLGIKPPSASDQYNTDYANSGIPEAQAKRNADAQKVVEAQAKLTGVNNTLIGINARANIQNIGLESGAVKTGSVSSGFLNKQQQEVNRQATIETLSHQTEVLSAQAEVAAAQGNATLSQSILQQAQDHLDKVFQIHQTDANNKYQYQKDLFDKVIAEGDKQEARQAEVKKTELATNQSNLADARNNAQAISAEVFKSNPVLASKISALTPPDTSSKTFASDLATYNSKVAALQGQSTPNTLDNQYKTLQIQKLQSEISQAKATGSEHVSIVNDAGSTVSIPIDVAPYYNVASNGVEYIDASTLQGTAKDKTAIINQANKAGYKVITNKNTAADLVNIKDANAKLDTVSTIMSGIAQPGWLARSLGGLGLTKLSQLAQSDPQKAAAGTLESIGLDILKAISGVQGFRGNQVAIQQVTDHLPKVTDTIDTINAKIGYVKALIADRENAAVGKAKSDSINTDMTVGGVTYYKDKDGLYYPKQ